MNPWVVCPKPITQARLRLFCFPHAGGSATVFRTWPDDLPPNIEVYSIQLPGREGRLREPLFTDLKPLVDALVPALRPYLNLPYAFFGHSVGALISFELARALIRQNLPGPIHLLVSGRPAPQLPDSHPPIHQLPDPEFIQELRRLNGTPRDILQNTELMELFLPVLRADFAINETYVYTPGTLLECPLSAFGGLHDSISSRDDLVAWCDQSHGTFTLHMFPGDHFYLLDARASLLEAITQDLTQSISRITYRNWLSMNDLPARH